MFNPAVYQDFARAIAPEVAERPLYFIDTAATDDAAVAKASRGCFGWAEAVDHEEHEIADVIGDEWCGPGRVVTMNTREMLRAAGLDNFDEYALALVIHELAHLLPWPRRWSRKVMEKLEAAHSSPSFVPAEKPAAFPTGEDPYHDVSFARRCAHLWARAKAAGYEINPRVILTAVCEDQLLLETVIVHCAGEFITLKDKTFADIGLHPMPARLVEEWNDHVELVKSWEAKRPMNRSI